MQHNGHPHGRHPGPPHPSGPPAPPAGAPPPPPQQQMTAVQALAQANEQTWLLMGASLFFVRLAPVRRRVSQTQEPWRWRGGGEQARRPALGGAGGARAPGSREKDDEAPVWMARPTSPPSPPPSLDPPVLALPARVRRSSDHSAAKVADKPGRRLPAKSAARSLACRDNALGPSWNCLLSPLRSLMPSLSPCVPLAGAVAEQLSDLDRAQAAYEHALRHNPASISALTQVAGIARAKDDFGKVNFSARSSTRSPDSHD